MEILSTEEIVKLNPEDQRHYLTVLTEYQTIKRYNKGDFFIPYEWQKKFYDKGNDQNIRALICANRVGKTFSACMEVAYHLTGRYPDWWEGRRWTRPIRAAVTSVTFSQVRDVLQKELVGTQNRDIEDDIGTGTIPRDTIDIDKSSKARDGAFSELFVKHSSGGFSSVKFFAYSQGMEPMQGWVADLVLIDEQDKNKFDLIFSELVKRTATVNGLVLATFTPLQGLTHIVRQFWDSTGDFHGGMVNAGWDDAPHISKKARDTMLSATPPHLQDAVTKGIPVLGSGAVFNIGEEEIMYDDIEIGPDWPRICAVDIGFTIDPTAAVFLAKDPSTGILYMYDEYGSIDNNTWNPSQHVGHLHAKNCSLIPIMYDSAAAAKVGSSGKSITELWREMGLNVSAKSFSNPKHLSEKASSYKDLSIGLTYMYEMMVTGRLKVHRRCQNWWREFRSYSYDDKGVPSAKDNHWMDASRYAVMSAEKGLMEVPTPHRWNNHEEDDDLVYNVI